MTKKSKKAKAKAPPQPNPALVALFVTPMLEFMDHLLQSTDPLRHELRKPANAAFQPIAERAAECYIELAGAALGTATHAQVEEWQREALRRALVQKPKAA